MNKFEKLDEFKRYLQRKRQQIVDADRSPALLDKLIRKTQLEMNQETSKITL